MVTYGPESNATYHDFDRFPGSAHGTFLLMSNDQKYANSLHISTKMPILYVPYFLGLPISVIVWCVLRRRRAARPAIWYTKSCNRPILSKGTGEIRLLQVDDRDRITRIRSICESVPRTRRTALRRRSLGRLRTAVHKDTAATGTPCDALFAICARQTTWRWSWWWPTIHSTGNDMLP